LRSPSSRHFPKGVPLQRPNRIRSRRRRFRLEIVGGVGNLALTGASIWRISAKAEETTMFPRAWVARALFVLILAAINAGSVRADDAPGVKATAIKFGQTIALSGPASAYSVVGRAEAAYFRMINEQGGVNGRKLNFLDVDDAYSPPKTIEQTRRLVEQEGVAFLFNGIGTAAEDAGQGRHITDVAAHRPREVADRLRAFRDAVQITHRPSLRGHRAVGDRGRIGKLARMPAARKREGRSGSRAVGAAKGRAILSSVVSCSGSDLRSEPPLGRQAAGNRFLAARSTCRPDANRRGS
jgi:hypothetical protein